VIVADAGRGQKRDSIDAVRGSGEHLFLRNASSPEAKMNLLGRRSLALPAVALVAGLAAGALFLAKAQGEPRWAFQVCHALGSDAINESPFLAENGAAMTKMMNDMAVEPAGDVDADFVAMMTPHHQGAIEMAKAVLRYGRNAQIKRLAQEIIVTQQQEIAAMRFAIGEPLPPSIPSPTPLIAWHALETR
jgi:Domain of unknown function (DUF305)